MATGDSQPGSEPPDLLAGAAPATSAPLLPEDVKPRQLSSVRKTFGNIMVSIVGAGVLGLPYTFMKSGWLCTLLILAAVAALSFYGMLLLVRCRAALHAQRGDAVPIGTYGELGLQVGGAPGMVLVDLMLLCSQCGFCVAYLIFIGQNVSSLLYGDASHKAIVILVVAPLQMLLSWLRSLTRLAPLSIMADVMNLAAYAIVLFHDAVAFEGLAGIRAYTGWAHVPFALGVAVYAYEGVGITLPLEGAMEKKARFPATLGLALALITALYGGFGVAGYLGFGDATQEIVTLNLPAGWASAAVKLGICFALFFTFPVMMHPVYAIYEKHLLDTEWFRAKVQPSSLRRKALLRALRAALVAAVVGTAIGVPNFALFISLIGSSFCAALGFVLPAAFHLRVLWGQLAPWELAADAFMLAFGAFFGVWGTYDTLVKIFYL